MMSHATNTMIAVTVDILALPSIYFRWNKSSVSQGKKTILFAKCSLNSVHLIMYQCNLLKAEHTLCIRCGTVLLAMQTAYLFILNMNSAAKMLTLYFAINKLSSKNI